MTCDQESVELIKILSGTGFPALRAGALSTVTPDSSSDAGLNPSQ